MLKNKLPPPTEYDEAVVFADYLRLKGHLFSHLAQETFTKSWAVRMRNKRQGVNRGVPDYIIVIKNQLLFVELKKKGGTLSREQLTWIRALLNCGATVCVAYGAKQAIEFIKTFE